MSKARDEFYEFYTQHKIDHSILFNYINELEQEKTQYKKLAEINLEALEIANKHIANLKAEKVELIESFRELLYDAMSLYQHDPNNFRKTADKYFKTEIEILQKYTGK